MEFAKGIKCEEGLTIFLPADEFIPNVQQGIGVEMTKMKKLPVWQSYVEYVSFKDADLYDERSGKYQSIGNLKIEIDFTTKKIRYGSKSVMNIVEVFEVKNCIKVVAIAGMFMTPIFKDRFVSEFWVNAGKDFFKLLAKSANPRDVSRLCTTNKQLSSWCGDSFYAEMLQHHYGEVSEDPKSRFIELTFKREHVETFFETHAAEFKLKDSKNDLTNNTAVPESFFDRHPELFDFEAAFFESNIVSEEFINRHWRKLSKDNWEDLSVRKDLSAAFVKKWQKKLDWGNLSVHLPESVLVQFVDKIDWDAASANPNLSEAFLRKHSDKLEIEFLSENPAAPVDLLEADIGNVEWDAISSNPSLHKWEAFARKYAYVLNFNFVCLEPMSEKFFEDHFDRLVWREMSKNTFMSEAFFERHLKHVDWYYLCHNTGLSTGFFMKHINKIAELDLWPALIQNTNVKQILFEKELEHQSKNPEGFQFATGHWIYLCQRNFSVAFFEQYIDKVNWTIISSNPFLPVSFFERHYAKTKKPELARNPGLSPEFFERHIKDMPFEELAGNNFGFVERRK